MLKSYIERCTRRTALSILGLGAPAVVLVGSNVQSNLSGGWEAEAAFRAWLEALQFPFESARLDLLEFMQTEHEGLYQMRVLLRLTWPPGLRQFYVTSLGADPRQAVDILAERTEANFLSVPRSRRGS